MLRVIDAIAVIGNRADRLHVFEAGGQPRIMYRLDSLTANHIYPLPRFTDSTVALAGEFDRRSIIYAYARLKHVVSRDRIRSAHTNGREVPAHRGLNAVLAAVERRYGGAWTAALTYPLALCRPLRRRRARPNLVKLLTLLEPHRAAECGTRLKKLLDGNRPGRASA